MRTRRSRWTNAAALLLVVSVPLLGACGGRAAPSTPSAASASSTPSASSTGPVDPAYAPGRRVESFEVDGVTRTAVVVVPTDLSHPVPLVFAFHGHGGNGAAFDDKIDIEGEWPDAIVVYPDGLAGHQGITDPAGALPGWQTAPGESGDRDLAFFDVMLATLRAKTPVDPERIYVTGHSNGSAFTSLLLDQRGDAIAATANISAQPGARLLAGDPVRSMFLSMGEQDPIVPYATQKASIPLIEDKLGVDTASATVDGYLRIEHGPDDIELDVYVHPAGHEVPAAVPPLVVAFFQRHTLSGG